MVEECQVNGTADCGCHFLVVYFHWIWMRIARLVKVCGLGNCTSQGCPMAGRDLEAIGGEILIPQ